MKKNGRQLVDVMDLDEVYYDASTYGRSYRGKRRDAGKKIIENEVYGECWIIAKEGRESWFAALFRRQSAIIKSVTF